MVLDVDATCPLVAAVLGDRLLHGPLVVFLDRDRVGTRHQHDKLWGSTISTSPVHPLTVQRTPTP